MDHKKSPVLFTGLDIAMLAFGGLHNPEMHFQGIRHINPVKAKLLLLRHTCFPERFQMFLQIDGETGKIFGGLDVVLVCIGPVQLDLFAKIGNCKRCGPTRCFPDKIPPGNKIPIVIVPFKKPVQMVIHIPFQSCLFPQ